MSIPQAKQKDRIFKPIDPIYAGLIDDLRLKIKHREGLKPGVIRAKKVDCLHRFEAFNNVRAVNKVYSLYLLTDKKELRNIAVSREFETGGERTCFLDGDGNLSKIVLHIEKDLFKDNVLRSLAKKLSLGFNIISSFKDPKMYVGACFSRQGEDPKSKVIINRKAAGIFKKLCKVISSYSFVDII